MKAQRQPLASPAVRYRQEDIGRLCLLEEENERLRHQLTTMSASMGGSRGDDKRVGVLEEENVRLRQQMMSLEERLEEVERAKLAVAEETEAMVRREVTYSILCFEHSLCFLGWGTSRKEEEGYLVFQISLVLLWAETIGKGMSRHDIFLLSFVLLGLKSLLARLLYTAKNNSISELLTPVLRFRVEFGETSHTPRRMIKQSRPRPP
jgi:hypothetical protein